MAGFDGNGNYIRSYSWTTDAANGVDITASKFDTEDNGYAGALSICVTRDGQGKMTADFLPKSDATYALGSATFQWTNLFLSGTATVGATGANAKLVVNGQSIINGFANDYGAELICTTTTGQSFGQLITAGTNAADFPLFIRSADATRPLFKVNGLGDTVARGVALCKFKAALTSRVTTATPANDPDLAISIPAAGTYKFSCLVLISQGGGGSIGARLNMNYSGSVTGTASAVIVTSLTAASGFTGGLQVSVATSPSTTSASVANVSTIAGVDYYQFEGVLTCTTIGTFALGWSQGTSSATATTVGAGSYLTVTQVS